MKDFSSIILKCFSDIGLNARDNQVDTINRILNCYITDGKHMVVLNAPTGTGKSIIGVITSLALSDILKNNLLQSFILMNNNSLVKQYKDSLDSCKNLSLSYMMGKGTYKCAAINDTAESCLWSYFRKNGSTKELKKCNACKYLKDRNNKNVIKNLITNYSLFFMSSFYNNSLNRRLLTVYDEAHMFNDIFVNHMAIQISQSKLNKYMLECENTLKNELRLWTDIVSVKGSLEHKKINKTNYRSYLNKLHFVYKSLGDKYEIYSDNAIKINNIDEYKKYNRLSIKYKGLAHKIDDFVNFEYDHVVKIDYDGDNNEVTISPIFVGKMFNDIKNSDYHLFMSATIDQGLISKTIDVDEDDIGFVTANSVFPKENKKIVFLNLGQMNYKSMQSPALKNNIKTMTKEIVKNHSTDRGLVLSPSFFVNKMIATYLKKELRNADIKIYEHKQGEHLSQILDKYKKYKKPSVLLTPSGFEGLDLPDEMCRYQIIVKSPYASLGDERVKYILDNHPEIYNKMTLYKIIQGAGRAVRNKDDHSTVYCFDNSSKVLFNSKLNLWKEEFLYETY